MSDLVKKYNIAVPRYTSYPTVPYWENNVNEEVWKEQIKNSFIQYNRKGISLYIHLPYCESLCTYCACNTRITVNHQVEKPYIEALLKEWRLYKSLFNEVPLIKEIHLGGGTPTFFSPENLHTLISEIIKDVAVHEDYDFSFEGHPSNTTKEHLRVLFNLGFRRVSFGVQDFDEKIQEIINRYQTFEEVKSVIDSAREIGFRSINLDLVYGLPLQSPESINNTINKVIQLKPDRIAFYSYAHVPWLKPGQRKYSDKDLPEDHVKRKLYEIGREAFLNSGYTDIGMDHFALTSDELFIAFEEGKLHRNFMGYTDKATKLLIGLGCSAISDSWDCFSQNVKVVEDYIALLNQNKFPIFKGHLLTGEDLKTRQDILNLMCKYQVIIDPNAEELLKLEEPLKDNLIKYHDGKLEITDEGKLFIRNICLAFDKRYWMAQPQKQIFSTSA
ncbi:MAG: oxygen-independent coproporphyrinogen III oxidase [Sphingobacteriaceae bacterium]|nr:oxygen-independent coproporphyrinogen III oxidase [Sphingobacteriaceae bacterium]